SARIDRSRSRDGGPADVRSGGAGGDVDDQATEAWPFASRRPIGAGGQPREKEAPRAMSSLVGPDEDDPRGKPPVPEDVQEAVRTLIRWAGDDPTREGLLDTPKRVARAWKEYCIGYTEDPSSHLSRMFEEVGGYDEIVLLKDIPFQSHCEHHMAPIIGKAAIAYLP